MVSNLYANIGGGPVTVHGMGSTWTMPNGLTLGEGVSRNGTINITGGGDMTLFEVDCAARRVQQEVHPEANIIFGSAFDENMEGKIRVSLVAAGIDIQQTGSE